jgi:transposase
MAYSSEQVREVYAESLELRRRIYEMIDDGSPRKEIASRLCVSQKSVDYHLKFNRPDGCSNRRKLQGALANALTREAFLREALKRSDQMYRRLWWETKSTLPSPVVKRSR